MNGLPYAFHASWRPATLFWHAEISDLLQRIDCLCSRAEPGVSDIALLNEMGDVLAEGYVRALYGEGRSRRVRLNLERLVVTLESPKAAVDARRVALRKRTVDQRVSVLRERLATLREHFL